MKYNVQGTTTGRYSSAQPNVSFSKLPKGKAVFVPDKEYVLIETDFSCFDEAPAIVIKAMHQPHITNYPAREASREAYLSWLSRAIESRRDAALPSLNLPDPMGKQRTANARTTRGILSTI